MTGYLCNIVIFGLEKPISIWCFLGSGGADKFFSVKLWQSSNGHTFTFRFTAQIATAAVGQEKVWLKRVCQERHERDIHMKLICPTFRAHTYTGGISTSPCMWDDKNRRIQRVSCAQNTRKKRLCTSRTIVKVSLSAWRTRRQCHKLYFCWLVFFVVLFTVVFVFAKCFTETTKEDVRRMVGDIWAKRWLWRQCECKFFSLSTRDMHNSNNIDCMTTVRIPYTVSQFWTSSPNNQFHDFKGQRFETWLLWLHMAKTTRTETAVFDSNLKDLKGHFVHEHGPAKSVLWALLLRIYGPIVSCMWPPMVVCSYAGFLERFYWLVLLLTTAIAVACIAVAVTTEDLPSFDDPTKVRVVAKFLQRYSDEETSRWKFCQIHASNAQWR